MSLRFWKEEAHPRCAVHKRLSSARSFKYETLTGLQHVLKPNDYAFTVDLKAGYHHVDTDERFWTFLGFHWDNQFYVFTQLPFGLAPACWAFTKVTRDMLTL